MSKKSDTKRPFVVGLTGGIGSGKTAVSECFADLGVEIVDADVVARAVVEPGTDALNTIVNRFGSTILNEDGSLNRNALRNEVFTDEAHKTWLNALLHPIIRQQMQAAVSDASGKYCILAVPLLVENNLLNIVDRVLVIDCPVETQVARASRRDNNSEQTIRNIIAAQATREARLAVANDVIDNSGSIEAIKPQVEKLHQQYLTLSFKRCAPRS